MEKAIGKKSARTKSMEKWEDKDIAIKNRKEYAKGQGNQMK